jgi:hypothetical protein
VGVTVEVLGTQARVGGEAGEDFGGAGEQDGPDDGLFGVEVVRGEGGDPDEFASRCAGHRSAPRAPSSTSAMSHADCHPAAGHMATSA